MVNDNVNCEQVWRELSNYIEGDVTANLRVAMDDHFRTCKRCTSVLEGTRNVVSLYSDERLVEETTIEAPVGFSRRMEKRLAQNLRASSRRWSTWSAWLVPVAALALIAGGVEIASSWTLTRPIQSPMAQLGRGIPPDMQVVVSDGAKIFHVAGCDFIHNKDKIRTLTAKQAIDQGYVPCLRCMRKYLETARAGHSSLGVEADATVDDDDNDSGQ